MNQRDPIQYRLLVIIIILAASVWGDFAPAASASPESDRLWQAVLNEAAGPGNRFKSQEEAVKAIRAHLDRQEATLRDFARMFPDDPRHYSAVVRLSGVLAAKGRMLKNPEFQTEARRLLTGIEDNASLPLSIRADAGFARISQTMDEVAGQDADDVRDSLLSSVRSFDASYPTDRRTPGLLTEIATLFDSQPAKKKPLLDEAAARATEESLRQRIRDDQKRLARLGIPLDMQLTPRQGGKSVQVSSLRGRVVVILFWASWSLPALRELAQLEQISAKFAGQPVEFVTVSLDKDRKALAEACRAADLRWVVQCDGRGWEGETVRALGINALPTVWILDRKGSLMTLNARGQEAVALIQNALAEK